MPNFKLYGKCVGCLKKRWFIRKRKVTLPIGSIAMSKDLMCTKCYKKLKQVL